MNASDSMPVSFANHLTCRGSAAANAISQLSLAVLLFIYIRWKGLYKATWGGWSQDCLQEWGQVTQLAIPSMLLGCLDWWVFEIGGFLAGLISEVELGAQSVMYELINITYMLPLGFSVAASVRIGNAMGAGNIEQAKLSGKLAVICAVTVSCLVGAVLVFSKDVIGYIFSTEQEIVQRVSNVMILCGLFTPADATACVTSGIIRGTGRQKIGAIGSLVGFYCIGFPIGVSLMFAAKMGIVGLWLGLLICVTVQLVFFALVLWKLNWRKASAEAKMRAGFQVTETNDVPATENNSHSLTTHGESQVSIISANFLSNEDVNSDMEMLTGAQVGTVADVQSVRQLLWRRGLTLLFMILLLGVAIVISELLTKTFK